MLNEKYLVYNSELTENLTEQFNKEKDFRKVVPEITAETNKKILSLQPVKDFRALVQELIILRCIPEKHLYNIFTKLIEKLKLK